MEQSKERIQYLDFMRGFAVVLMVMGHSIDSVLSLQVRSTEMFRLYDAVRGVTAPLFLFVSGYAFSVATEKKWSAYLTFDQPLFSRLRKILLLFVLGYALHFPFFSFDKLLNGTQPKEYALLFQVDVLHCVAISLLLLQVIIVVARTPRAFAVTTLGLAAGIVLATPIIWSVDFATLVSPVLAPYFNQKQVSIFPIFPFVAFMFSGAVAGHFYLEARGAGTEQGFFKKFVVIGICAGVCGLVFDLLPISFYPPHDYWKTSPSFFLIRIGMVCLITGGFFYLRQLPTVVARHLVTLGQASLMVYVIHLAVVYGSPANIGLMHLVGQTLQYHQAFVIGIAVLLSMLALVYLWKYLHTHHYIPAKVVQFGLAGTLLLQFFTNPY